MFQIKIYQKISKTRVIEITITIPLTLETKQQLSIKPRKSFLALKVQKILKNAKQFQKI